MNDDKAWSLTKEYELNKNNYIFTNKFPLKRILSDLSKENDKLKKKKMTRIGYTAIKYIFGIKYCLIKDSPISFELDVKSGFYCIPNLNLRLFLLHLLQSGLF